MRNISFDKQIGLSAVLLPMAAVLFWLVAWEGDPRAQPVVQKLNRLKNSRWSWDQAEYQRMLDTIDVNQLVDGKPLFIILAIDDRDPALLKRMLARGANVNSSDWGCTPLLAALELDSKLPKLDYYGHAPEFTKLMLLAGANPNLVPSPASLDRRLATGIPKNTCSRFDELFQRQKTVSALHLAVVNEVNDDVLSLLLTKGAKPSSRDDAQAILNVIASRMADGDAMQEVITLTAKHGANVDGVEQRDNTLSSNADTSPLAYAIGSEKVAYVQRFVKSGADPNRRTAKGELPLQIAIARCRPRWTASVNDEENIADLDVDYVLREWRRADRKTQEANREVTAMIDTLLIAGADPNLPIITDSGSISLLAYAAKRCSSDISQLLLAHGAKVDATAVQAASGDLKTLLRARDQSHSGPLMRKETDRPWILQ